MLVRENITYGDYTYGFLIPRGGENKVTVGKFCSLAEETVVDCGFNHMYDRISTYPFHMMDSTIQSNIEKPRDIQIGNDVWVGENCLIMEGAHISDGVVIGARSLIKRGQYIGPYEIWAGVPAKFIKHRFAHLDLNKGDTHSREVTRKLLKLKWWNLPEEEIKNIAPILGSDNFEKLFKLYNIE